MGETAFDLVIWDCDGCLVDSEHHSCGLAADILTGLGYPISAEDFIIRFCGSSFRDIFRLLQQETGVDYGAIYPLEEAREKLNEIFSATLQPIDGALDVVSSMPVRQCVASGSSPSRVLHSLRVTGLLPYLQDALFSASDVPRGKPDPDLFFLAAKTMGVAPSRCLVIEDSILGVTAAKAAGMKVAAFFGGSHVTPEWQTRVISLSPDFVIGHLRDIHNLLTA